MQKAQWSGNKQGNYLEINISIHHILACSSGEYSQACLAQPYPPYKQDHGLLFTVNKDNWPIRWEYLSHVTIIMQNGRLPAKLSSSPLFQIRKLPDDKIFGFIVTHFLLIMPYQWYGFIKASVMGRSLMRTTLTTLRHGILFCVTWFPYVKILRESRQKTF